MVINNEDLRENYNLLETIEYVLQKEVATIKNDKSRVDKIVPERLLKVYSLKQNVALTFADNLVKIAYENSVISLVATFEKIVFAKYRTSYGTIRKLVAENAKKPLDYFKAREKFINDNIDKLSGIIYLIEGHISGELLEKLKLIKDHRNYIAHGKRDVAAPAIEMKISEIVMVLDNVIREIES